MPLKRVEKQIVKRFFRTKFKIVAKSQIPYLIRTDKLRNFATDLRSERTNSAISNNRSSGSLIRRQLFY